jgi:DNA polymerase III delta subunit
VRWTQTEAKRLGGSIEPRAAQDLLGRLFPVHWSRAQNPPYDKPPDLATLTRTLETLLLYAGDRAVSTDDVLTMVAAETSDQMFAFTDSVFSGDTTSSLKLLVQEGVDDDSAAKLLGYAGTQSELSLIVASADRHENLGLLGKELGSISEGRLVRLQKSAGGGAPAAVSQDVAAADRRLKTGKVRGVQSQLFDLLIARARNERGH